MKKLIKKILAKKGNRVVLSVLLLAILVTIYFTITGISKNVELMSQTDEGGEPYFPTYPVIDMKGKDPSLIQRGEYIAKAGDCIACHTNSLEKGPTFAGGLPMQTPFGVIYSPNITPDKETGIGNWTEEQFITAMQKGISPHGSYYYPAFPYLYFSRVSIDDLKALKAYLDSIPAVTLKNKPNKMVWPFNQRLLQLPWRILFFHPQKPSDLTLGTVENQTDQLVRGAYLVEGLGHCSMCHSPSYHIISDKLSLGAPMRKFDLTGAKVQGFLAPDISKKNLGEVSVEEIIDVFLKDKLIGGGQVEGPMLEVNHDSLRYLNRSDLEAIAVYLKNVQSASPPKPKVAKGEEGKATYETYCSGCHAEGAGGAPKFGDGMSWSPILKQGMNKVYINAIKGIGGMPAKGTCITCSDDDIKKAVDYMVSAVPKNMTAVAPIKPLTPADGKRLYEENCSVCHTSGFKNAPKPGDKARWKPILQQGFLTIYTNVLTGKAGHPERAACPTCSDAEIKAALKYMLDESSTNENFNLW